MILDLIVFDLRLPDITGEEVAAEVGADDYVTKPFSPRELVLRVTAILRRGRTSVADVPSQSFGECWLVVGSSVLTLRNGQSAYDLRPRLALGGRSR